MPAAPVEASGDRAVRAGRAVWAVTPEAVTVIEVVKGDVDEVVLIGGGCGSLEASGHGKVWVPKVTPWDAWEPWDPRLLLLGSLRFRVMAAFTAEPAEAIMEAWWAGGGQMGSWMESTALAAEMEPMVERWDTLLPWVPANMVEVAATFSWWLLLVTSSGPSQWPLMEADFLARKQRGIVLTLYCNVKLKIKTSKIMVNLMIIRCKVRIE